MPRKIRELVRDLVRAGFKERSGKDGDDARRHLEKAVQEAINEVNQWRKATDT